MSGLVLLIFVGLRSHLAASPAELLCTALWPVVLCTTLWPVTRWSEMASLALISFANRLECCLLVCFSFFSAWLMLHCVSLASLALCLEAYSLCTLMLGFLAARGRALRALLSSAAGSGVLLFFLAVDARSPVIVSVILFKLGAAGAHRWAVDWLVGVPASVFVFLTVVPEVCLLLFWQSQAWTVVVPAGATLSQRLGAVMPHGMRTRGVLAFSSITTVGLLLVAKPSPVVYQYLWVYSASLVALLGAPRAATSYVGLASLAGLPPTAGFFGKAWIFWSATARHSFWLVLLANASALLSTVYSLRLTRCTPAETGRAAGAPEAAATVLLLFGPSLIVKPLADALWARRGMPEACLTALRPVWLGVYVAACLTARWRVRERR